jgi:AcrR family transcriptional regulator
MATAERHLRADARRNRERLVAVAREAFAEHGIEASLDDIARRAAVGPGTLYRHFPTREALLAEVYRGDVEALTAQADELAERYPAGEALFAWLRLHLDYVKGKRGTGAAIKAMLAADSEMLEWCRETMRSAAGRLVARAQEAGAIRDDIGAVDVLKLVHGIGYASESAPDQADRLLAVVLDGLRPQRGR